MMTPNEAAAQAIFDVLDAGATEWKEAQAKLAAKAVEDFFKVNELSPSDFSAATMIVSANVSAMKQKLEKFGLLENTSTPELIVKIKKLKADRDVDIAKLATK